MAGQNMEQFESFFQRADLDRDGRISGTEAVSFSQGFGLPKQVLAQIWTYADQNRTGFLGRQEFYNFLKLVTVAQSKRDLTPEIVKVAIYGPASAQIPPPKMNLGTIPAPNSNSGSPAGQLSNNAPPSSQGMGVRGPQGFLPQQNQITRPPRPPIPNTAFHTQQVGVGQGIPRGGTVVASQPPSSSISSDWLGGRAGAPSPSITPQFPTSGVPTSMDGFGPATQRLISHAQPRPQTTTGLPQHIVPQINGPTSGANQAGTRDLGSFSVSGNGSVSGSVIGDAFSGNMSQENLISSVPTTSGGPIVSSAGNSGSQPTIRPSHNGSFQGAPPHQPTGVQSQHAQPTVKQYPQVPVQSFAASPAGAGNSASVQSQMPWPKMTQTDVQKYSKVFMEVDTDRDGKITGEQARNLFLSWRLPREVLKQVWDLSDQDNDSMLSLKEFCIALYLMERHREGRPLPRMLPASIMFEEAMSSASGQSAVLYGNPSWRPPSGLQQGHGITGPRPVTQPASGRPPRPVPIPQPDEDMQPRQQKPTVPVLEKFLVDQLSTEEQNSLNSKFQEATEADKKVNELEKEILESKEKIEFYRTKMQELIFYKSRCDNRLNEITERVAADKREVELLAKKYEEKYKQSGDVASKLTIEEATFRDIQEKKMELYRAIVKLEEIGGGDDLQVRVDRIQAELEEQVKALNERCKMYGLRAKPTSLIELPFGWQPGVQEGAADWDENWDKFEDEGFTFLKELTLDVQNVIAPPKTKSLPVQKKSTFEDEGATVSSSSDANVESEDVTGAKIRSSEDKSPSAEKNENLTKSPPRSPASRNVTESPTTDFQYSPSGKNSGGDRSPHASPTSKETNGNESPRTTEAQSEHSDKRFDEPGWGTFGFGSRYDIDTTWDFKPIKTEDMDNESHNESSFFDPDGWGLNPIRTGVPKKSSFVFDSSVPSTPALSYAGSPRGENLFQKKSPFGFADSVPGTPAYSYAGSPLGDNAYHKKSPFGFADSVPSTPMYSGNSPQRFSEGTDDQSFKNFSRFDSFSSTYDGGLFPSRETFSRFDSFRSTQDSEYDQGGFPPSLTRFDSMHSSADSEFGNSLFQPRDSSSFARFDSMRSTKDPSEYSHGFPSFDDSDPFGSSDPFRSSDSFKASIDSQKPRRDTDSWRAF